MRLGSTTIIGGLIVALAACMSPEPSAGSGTSAHSMSARLPGGCEAPARENPGQHGCYFDQSIQLGRLSSALFWHLDEFPDAGTATEQAKGRQSAVVRTYGRVFLHTFHANRQWRPEGGRRLATVGPLEAPRGAPVTARVMQAMTSPGAATQPHRHDGPEAFYVLSGSICMETPAGAQTTAAGETYVVNGDIPMQLTSAGDEVRRSLFVVLHRSSEPWMKNPGEWTPSGACAGR